MIVVLDTAEQLLIERAERQALVTAAAHAGHFEEAPNVYDWVANIKALLESDGVDSGDPRTAMLKADLGL